MGRSMVGGGDDANVIVETDPETSIQYLVKDIIDNRKEGRTILEESPVKNVGSNEVGHSSRYALLHERVDVGR